MPEPGDRSEKQKEYTRLWSQWLKTDDGKNYDPGELENQLHRGRIWCYERIMEQLESELAASLGREEALRGEVERLKQHAGHTPSMDTVRKMHSGMTTSDFSRNSSPFGGHRVYNQDENSQCYLCAVFDEVDRLNAELSRLRAERDAYTIKPDQIPKIKTPRYPPEFMDPKPDPLTTTCPHCGAKYTAGLRCPNCSGP